MLAAAAPFTHVTVRENPGDLRMLCYVPNDLPRNAPLVVVLHGGQQSATSYAVGAGWLTLADRLGFALLCPEQTFANNLALCFNWFDPGDAQRDQDEAASIQQMIQLMLSTHDLGSDEVFITDFRPALQCLLSCSRRILKPSVQAR